MLVCFSVAVPVVHRVGRAGCPLVPQSAAAACGPTGAVPHRIQPHHETPVCVRSRNRGSRDALFCYVAHKRNGGQNADHDQCRERDKNIPYAQS